MTTGADAGCDCAILLFPLAVGDETRRALGRAVDDASLKRGYTHVAVQCCQDDGNTVAIQATMKLGVDFTNPFDWKNPPNGEPEQPYGRVALNKLNDLGVTCAEFCKAAKALRGTPYSPHKLRHLGREFMALLADRAFPPDGIVCTQVATRSLGANATARIFAWLQLHHCCPPGVAGLATDGEIYISPNGFALAFDLPHGDQVTAAAQELTPTLLC